MRVFDEVKSARVAAHEKHGENSIEGIAGGDPRWLSILVEEVGERIGGNEIERVGIDHCGHGSFGDEPDHFILGV